MEVEQRQHVEVPDEEETGKRGIEEIRSRMQVQRQAEADPRKAFCDYVLSEVLAYSDEQSEAPQKWMQMRTRRLKISDS